SLRAPTPRLSNSRFNVGGSPSSNAGKNNARSLVGPELLSDRIGLATDDGADFDDELPDFETREAIDEVGGSLDGQIDDPVRMYLMQMGEIPLLSRDEEIAAAKQIEKTRRRFRHSMLASDYVLQGAVALLEKVRDGQLRLDRTIEVSVTNTAMKKKILQRLGPNLKTLVHLLQSNRTDFRIVISRSAAMAERRAAWRRLVRRRDKAVRLVE